MATYSTAQVAKLIGVDKSTLLRWLYSGAIREPRRSQFAGMESRVWTAADVERARKYKAGHYRKGRGRKKAFK